MVKQLWISMKQETTGWQWHQLDHMQIMYTSLQADSHASTSSLNFYRPDALPDDQPIVSKHWRQKHTCSTSYIYTNWEITNEVQQEKDCILQFLQMVPTREGNITKQWWSKASHHRQYSIITNTWLDSSTDFTIAQLNWLHLGPNQLQWTNKCCSYH